MTDKPDHPLRKGNLCIAHIQKTSQSLLAGRQVYSRWFIVECTKADKDGWCKAFKERQGVARSVDRFTEIHTISAAKLPACRKLFEAQALDFTGYETSDALRVAVRDTDRKAATIVKVTPTQVHVQEDISTRTDQNGMSESQTYSYAPDPNAPVRIFRKSKSGTYRAPNRGNGLLIGTRATYHDYSF